jgi:sodium/potassium-transporting ATPase subunit alpha
MKVHLLTADQALQSLQSQASGLSNAEAVRRFAEFGPNRMEEIRGAPMVVRFLGEFVHFFALILWVAAGLAFYAEAHQPGQGMGTMGIAILGVIVVNGLFSFFQEYRAERALSALRRLLPREVKVLRDGALSALPTESLVPGDVLLLEEGDDVPADARVIEAHAVRVNTATITGESLPKARNAEPSVEETILEARNMLLAGTAVISGEAKALVVATGMHTEFGRIAHLTQSGRTPPSPLHKEIRRLTRLIAVLATSLGVVFFLIGRSVGLSFWENFIFAIGIIVANVPEGLLPTVTLSLAMAAQRMAKRNALVRHLPAVETLGAASVIVTDKTGTLTVNHMTAHTVHFAEGSQEVRAIVSTNAWPESQRRFFEVAQRCHGVRDVTRDGEVHLSGDPMEIALVEMGRRALPERGSARRVDEIPFDADRKRMSVLYSGADGGRVLYTKGALERLLPLCASAHTIAGVVPLTDDLRRDFLAAENRLGERGLRVLGLAWRTVEESEAQAQWERGLILCGLAGLEDPPRAEVPSAMRRCRDAGIRVIMCTGDHPETARAIAREIGLAASPHPRVVTGEEMRTLSATQLQLALDTEEIIFARMAADQKLLVVKALRGKNEIVAVTGDGVNDAPALKHADIGIAMGASGTDVAREAADLILLDDNFASIVGAIEEGRAVYDNIRKFLTYILTSNVPELIPYLVFVLFKAPLALTIIQILAVDLGTDMLPALALGADKPAPDVMARRPRPRSERLLSVPVLLRAYLFLGLIEAAAAMAVFFFALRHAGWTFGTPLSAPDPLYLQATTAALSAIILMQVANVFICRDPLRSFFKTPLAGNRLILAGVASELVLLAAIVFTPWGNALFGAAPFDASIWLFILPFPLLMLALEEARKALARRWTAASSRR